MRAARCDHFLGGRVAAWQPVSGFRSGTDAVLLAAAVPALPGQTLLDLGCGAGVAGLCAAARTGARVTGLEREPTYAALARRNGLEVVEGDVGAMPAALRALRFDHVMTNPPFYDRGRGSRAPDPLREAALGEDVPLADWLDAALRRLAPRGTVSVVLAASRLADALGALEGRAGSVRVLPVAPHADEAARRVVLRAQKGGRAPLILLPPLILHRGDGEVHGAGSSDTHTERAGAILRGGAALPMGTI